MGTLKTLAGVAALALMAGAAQAGALTNGSFESKAVGWTFNIYNDTTTVPGWTLTGNDNGFAVEGGSAGQDGSLVMKLWRLDLATAPESRLAASAGTAGSLSFLYRIEASNTWSSPWANVDFFANQNDATPLSSASIALPHAGWQNGRDVFNFSAYTIDFVVPPGANYVGARIDMKNGTGNIDQQTIFVDHFVMSVPEPASMALLGLAGVGLLGRRRA